MNIIDSLRRHSPPRTPSPSSSFHRRTSSASRLTPAEIDEILESPYETNYTYSDSLAYKPHIGSNEYIVPRLCRRFPPSPQPKLQAQQQSTGTGLFYREKFSEWSTSIGHQFIYMLRFILVFAFTAVQYTLTKTFISTYRIGRFISINLLQVITAPFLWPYYAFRAYYHRAKYVWRSTRSVWTFLQWSWLWWTGQKFSIDGSPTVGVQTRSMAAQHEREEEKHKKTKNLAWLLLLLLLVGLTGYGYRIRMSKDPNQKLAHFETEQPQIQPEKPMEKPKIAPTAQQPPFAPHLAHPVGGPSLNVQEEAETAHHHDHPNQQHPSEIGGPFLSKFIPLTRVFSRVSEVTSEMGHMALHGIEDVVLAFFTALSEVASAIWQNFLKAAMFLARLPLAIVSFIYNWVCIPVQHFVANTMSAVWHGLCATAKYIASLPSSLWSTLRGYTPSMEFKWLRARMQFKEYAVAIFHWIRDKISGFGQWLWNGLKSTGNYGLEKVSQFCRFIADWTAYTFWSIYRAFNFAGAKFVELCMFVNNGVVQILAAIFNTIFNTIG